MPSVREDRGASALASSRYELLVKLAAGGMATVYVARLRGASGFTRLVAIKRPFGHLFENPTFKRMLIEEARIASHLHHPNVVAVQDVEELGGVLHLVMDYVEGGSLASLHAAGAEARMPARAVVRIALDAAAGLQAAHELHDDHGEPLAIVHRDVSPHNLLVGLDGVTRISDFGIAKFARSRVKTTAGSLKGKIGYMPPEYLDGDTFDARGDVFALAVVLWEALAGRRLFKAENDVESLRMILERDAPPISTVLPEVGELDDVLALALARQPDERFASAAAFASALETAARRADLLGRHGEVAAIVRERVGAALAARRGMIRAPVDAPTTDGAMVPEAPPLDAPSTASLDRMPSAAEAETPQVATGSLEGSQLPPRDEVTSAPRRSRVLLVAGAVAALAGGGALARVVISPATPLPATSSALADTGSAAPSAPAPAGTTEVAPVPSATPTASADATAPPRPEAPKPRAPGRPAPHPAARPAPRPQPAAGKPDDVAPNPY